MSYSDDFHRNDRAQFVFAAIVVGGLCMGLVAAFFTALWVFGL